MVVGDRLSVHGAASVAEEPNSSSLMQDTRSESSDSQTCMLIGNGGS